MELTDALKTVFIETAQTLKGHDRRRFMAQTVIAFGPGGQCLAERALGWNRETIRKGMREVQSGFRCIDATIFRRPKRAEERLPSLLDDIRVIVDSQSQTDPQFRSNRLYTRITAAEVRRQLILQKGYTNADLPTERTLLSKLNAMGYHLTTVAKAKPKKRFPKPMPFSND